MSDFPCTQCGACCKFGGIMELIPSTWILPSGICMHLAEDNSCNIYEDRPECCIIPPERYKENVGVCNVLQKLLGIDESYRVPEIEV